MQEYTQTNDDLMSVYVEGVFRKNNYYWTAFIVMFCFVGAFLK